ncbi:PepSY domain-containing protein [Metabacillus litoralis]|uniref:PepSY domain-containing protein n=1 Tax=Metabacillus TaxID=2675233 RepID=UPI001B97394B|nr:PepSY domain-containing protein [Metabacillus litoralis]MCM3162783.1 PepSY domain-containing protein [Metabacillus litoralis]MCM3410951.1 PepSY domain-containing protein [Metabacillus litoralis]UHA62173.1 PepSY domain-containing protein [Metabacillus litoralis]
MKSKYFLLGLGLGIAGTYLVKDQLKSSKISSEKALEIVKKAFKEKGPIDGSWIYTVPENFSTDHLSYEVYKAGVSRTVQDQLEQYEAFVDTNSGTIVHVDKIN